MVLDPFSALSLAGNIVQFVDFSCKLISESQEVYRSAAGASVENVEVEIIAENLSQLSDKLTNSSTPISRDGLHKDEAALAGLAASCKEVANELLFTIQRLRVKDGPRRKWRSFHQALKTVWKESKIVELQNRLNSLRNEMTIQTISIVR